MPKNTNAQQAREFAEQSLVAASTAYFAAKENAIAAKAALDTMIEEVAAAQPSLEGLNNLMKMQQRSRNQDEVRIATINSGARQAYRDASDALQVAQRTYDGWYRVVHRIAAPL